jgi:hypothetical protein
MFNIFEEISWPQYAQMSHISKLPLQEQINQYNQYLFQLEEARTSWIVYQNKGPIPPPTPIESGFLLQEDLFDLLQEDGSNIIITTLP